MTTPDAHYTPRLLPGVRLHHDSVRGQWVLLAPERVIELDDIAYAVLVLCDGVRTLEAVIAQLATEFDADVAEVRVDVLALIDDLAAKRLIRL